MNSFRALRAAALALAIQILWPASCAQAWDFEIHRLITQMALASLPPDFPEFAKSRPNVERVAFLSGEADRWRNSQDPILRHVNGPEHYFDVEKLPAYELGPDKLPVFRADFVGELAVIRLQHPDRFKNPLPNGDPDHTDTLPGLLPWALAEHQAKLKSCFSYLRAFERNGGTDAEIENARQNVLYVMGVMAHYAGDAGQPLHTTIHHHGWVGDNPNRYSTNSRIHSWIDGGYFAKIGLPRLMDLSPKVRPARLLAADDATAKSERPFRAVLSFVIEQNKTVETLYQIEKRGKFSGNGEVGRMGKPFLEEQMLKSAQLLGDLWWSAWKDAPDDSALRGKLKKRE